MDDECDCCTEVTARPFRLIDLAVIIASMARDIAGDIEHGLSLLTDCVMGHANHQVNQREFREQVAREIEALTEGDFPA